MNRVTIGVDPLVKFYLEKNFKVGNQVMLDRKSTVGKFFFKCIENPSNNNNSKSRPYKDSIVISISDWMFFNKGYVISPSDLTEFNNFVRKLIYQAVWLYIE